jgi:hypothetical protein
MEEWATSNGLRAALAQASLVVQERFIAKLRGEIETASLAK